MMATLTAVMCITRTGDVTSSWDDLPDLAADFSFDNSVPRSFAAR